MSEEIHAKQRHQIGQTPAKPGGQLQIAQQEHDNQRGPDLDLHGIGRGAHKGLDLEVLLQGLEEQFDLPAVFVDGSDGTGP